MYGLGIWFLEVLAAYSTSLPYESHTGLRCFSRGKLLLCVFGALMADLCVVLKYLVSDVDEEDEDDDDKQVVKETNCSADDVDDLEYEIVQVVRQRR